MWPGGCGKNCLKDLRNPGYIKDRFLLLLIFLVLSGASFSQGKNITIYLQELKKAQSSGEKYNAYLKVILHYKYIHADSTIFYCEQAIRDFERSNYLKGAVSIKVEYGLIYNSIGKRKMAEEIFREAILQSLENDSISLGTLYNYLGINYCEQARYDSCFHYLHKSVDANKRRSLMVRMRQLYILGDYQMAYGLLEEAEHSFAQVYAHRSELDYITNYVNLTYLIELYGRHMKNYDLYTLYRNELNQLQKTSKTHNRGNDFHYNDPFVDDLSPEQKEEFFLGALQANDRRGLSNETGAILINLLDHYKAQKQYVKQEALIKEFIQDKSKFNSLNTQQQMETLDKMQTLLFERGAFKDAYLVQDQLYLMRDSIDQLNDRKHILELENKYETARISSELTQEKLRTQKNRNQRNVLILVLGSIGVIAVIFESWRKMRQRNKSLQTLHIITEKDKAITESRMRLMRSQMNPHFLFNSLNSIKHFILQKPRSESAQYISDFSKLMRLNLQNSAEVLIPLDREIVFLKQYLHMEQMRFKDPFEVTWEIDENVHLDKYFFPPMLIQPFIENAIWHGLRYKKGKGKIDIKIYTVREDNIACIIQDNGIGREKSKEIRASSISLKKSMGTQITEDRISMTNDLLNADIRVHFEDLYDAKSNPTGTRVTINIPRIRETHTS